MSRIESLDSIYSSKVSSCSPLHPHILSNLFSRYIGNISLMPAPAPTPEGGGAALEAPPEAIFVRRCQRFLP